MKLMGVIKYLRRDSFVDLIMSTINGKNVVLGAIWCAFNDKSTKFGFKLQVSVYDKEFVRVVSKYVFPRGLRPRVSRIIRDIMKMQKTMGPDVFDSGISRNGFIYRDIADYMYKGGKTKWTNHDGWNSSDGSLSGEGSSAKNSVYFGRFLTNVVKKIGIPTQLLDLACGDGKSYRYVPNDLFAKRVYADLSNVGIELAKKELRRVKNCEFFGGVDMSDSFQTCSVLDGLEEDMPVVAVFRTVFQHMMFSQIRRVFDMLNELSATHSLYVVFTNLSRQTDEELNMMDVLPFGYRSLNLVKYLDLPEPAKHYDQHLSTGNDATAEFLVIYKAVNGHLYLLPL